MNRNSILRLSRYKNSLSGLKRLGFVKVFSDNIADATGETGTRVRKDFSMFGIAGSKKGGYNINELLERLNAILGADEQQNVALVGVGKIGAALMQYQGFRDEGLHIVAGFDIDPKKHRTGGSVPVYPISDLEEIAQRENIKIGVVAVPHIAAQQAFDVMVNAGIRGILNFAPVRLKGPENVVVSNVNLAAELQNLVYFVSFHEKDLNGDSETVSAPAQFR